MDESDFTVRLTREELDAYLNQLQGDTKNSGLATALAALLSADKKRPAERFRYCGRFRVKLGKKDPQTYRALICRCLNSSIFSATFRELKDTENPGESSTPALVVAVPGGRSQGEWPVTTYCHRDEVLPGSSGGRLFGIQHFVRALREELTANADPTMPVELMANPLEGLLVVAGRTGTCKSRIAESLIDEYLKNCNAKRPKRPPHLVTLQDPIENRFAVLGETEVAIDYTPRALGTDFRSLDEAVDDALRQTPAVLYVGEIRRQEEWKSILRFAGTGHFCVTTAHAGSLVETMRSLMEANEVNAADQRSSLANKLLGLIHLRYRDYEGPAPDRRPIRIIHPSLWCRSDRSVASFVSDGLASILPHRSGAGTRGWMGSLGRRYFADKLVKARNEELGDENSYPSVFEDYQMQSTAWDLKGE